MSTDRKALEEDRDSLERKLRQHRKNLARLEERAAKYTIDVPISVLNEIDEVKERIERDKARLEEILTRLEQAPPEEPSAELVRPGVERKGVSRRAVLFVVLGLGALGLLGIPIGWIIWDNNRAISTPTPVSYAEALVLPLADCVNSPNLTADFNTAVANLLSDAGITAIVQPGGTPVSDATFAGEGSTDVIIWGKCDANQVTYYVKLPTAGVDAESNVAEPESLSLTWPQDSVDVPAKVLAAAVAYSNGDMERAAAWLFETLQEWAQVDNPLERANIRFLLGNAWLRHREPSSGLALEQYEVALADVEDAGGVQVPLIASLHNNRGRAYLGEEKFEPELAEHEFTLALDADSSYVWALLNRSMAYLEIDRFSEAHKDCTQAIQQRGDFAPGYVCRAQVYYREESWADTLAAANEAIRIDPQYAPAYYFAGVSSCWQGDTPTAIEQLTKFLALSKDPVLRFRATAWLDSIQESSQGCEDLATQTTDSSG